MKNQEYIKKAFYIREFETFLLELFQKGELNGTVHTCVGQELTPVILSEFLKKGDKLFSNHRGHGHYLSFNGDPKGLISEMLGLETGISSGIGGSQHIMNDGFLSNGIQGGLTPVATGFAFANKILKNDNISIVFIGDGTLGTGILYESLNLAASLDSPVLFVLENNKYAQSTSNKQTLNGSVKKRVEGFGINYHETNIWDINDMESKLDLAVLQTRNGKPNFIEIECYRLNSHSKGDDNRSDSEINMYYEKDLLNIYKKKNEDLIKSYTDCFRDEFKSFYDQSKIEDIGKDTFQHSYIYSENVKSKEYVVNSEDSKKRINKLIYESLSNILKNIDNSLLIGEDIQNKSEFTEKNYGGAFKVTQDLSDLFPNKVFNSPISEAAIIGFGIGSSLNNFRSIVEIMFGDFLTLGFDQILQQASKIPEMYGKNLDIPLIIRTPMGGRRGYGPTHSQNIEKHFLFIPNISVYAINSVFDPRIIYDRVVKNDNKTAIIVEDKIAYTKFLNKQKIIGYNIKETEETFPTLIIEPEFVEPSHTIFTYGGMLDEVIDSLHDLFNEEFFPRIICPTRICPLNLNPVIKSLETANKLLFIEEGSKHGSLSSEVISYLTEKNISFNLFGRISNEGIIPCSKAAEFKTVPNKNLIINKILNKL